MFEENLARLHAHGNNIHRYRQLLATDLSDLEREHIEKRLQEEQSFLNTLSSVTFPSGVGLKRHASEAAA